MLSGYIAGHPIGGPLCEKLERRLENYYSVSYARVFNSATSALHACVETLHLKKGRRIPCPAYTMSATAAAIVHAGYTPHFVDISRDNFCIDFTKLKTRGQHMSRQAMVLVHLFGYHVTDIPLMAAKTIIHDCAQTPSLKPNKHRRRDMWVHSLNEHKIISCGEGGYVLTFSKSIADKLHAIRNHGEVLREDILGHNYRMTEMQAEVAIDELDELDNRLVARREVCSQYWPNSTNQDWWLAPALGVNIYNATRHQGYTTPLHRIPYFKNKSRYQPRVRPVVAEEIEASMIWYDPLELVELYESDGIGSHTSVQQSAAIGSVA